ncbi:Protein CicA [Candidatus Protochlamydia amoebophila]|uniref:HAD-IB family hydrolase n=1 Tax=Candidatus Protochlamydia amoebophila TaxID=362787 RepID=UPI001BC91931|nr:HAD-IB family hydrolase [Candidatus Protochlamydia amoebophila]MBS4163338.1 Protein CicA [Candidatus Protochlamydia amoebophila]
MIHPSVVAAFDFDKTLTNRDSLLPFLYEQTGFFRALWKMILLAPLFLKFFFGKLSRQEIKEKILTQFFKGMPIRQLKAICKRYADKKLDVYLNAQAIERLRWHQRQGHRCILVSASIDLYLRPWAERYGFEEIFASTLEVDSKGNVTGKLKGKNCWGVEKTKRLTNYLGPKETYQLYAYGDSLGDQELLALADYPFYKSFKTKIF